MAKTLAARARYVGHAHIRGRLYALDGYPGLIPDEGGEWIAGELFTLPEGTPGLSLLAALDDYEECSSRFPHPQEYRRMMLTIRHCGSALLAWTYIYNWPVDGRKQIAGDFSGDCN